MKMSKLSNQTNSQDPQAVNSRIFVGNLNTFQCSKTDVERMFQIYGRLAGISMHKGYAFVQFSNPFDARNACLGEDGKLVLSQTLDVNMVAEPKAHQVGRKRQNVNKTGNDWDYFYDSYCSSTMNRSNNIRAKKRKRLMSNSSRMVTLSDAVNSSNINAAVAAATMAQQQQQLAQHHQHHQQQQHHQQHQQAAAVAMAAMANLLPQQQMLLHQHQQNMLTNTNGTAACNGSTTAPHHASLNIYLQQQQQHQHMKQQQAAAAAVAAAQYAAVTNGGLQLKMSSPLMTAPAGPQAASSATLLTHDTDQMMATTTAPTTTHQAPLLKQHQTTAHLMQPLTLTLSPQQQQQQQQQQQHHLHHHQQQQQQHHNNNHHQQQHHHQLKHQQNQQQQIVLQNQMQQQEQLSSNQQWGPFKVYSNPDTLICGNCRECFNELSELLDHKKSYCKLRFTCKCQDTTMPAKNPSYGAKLLCAVCKDAFANPWDLMVHAQAAHMVNIYELGAEPNNNNSPNANNNNNNNTNNTNNSSNSNNIITNTNNINSNGTDEHEVDGPLMAITNEPYNNSPHCNNNNNNNNNSNDNDTNNNNMKNHNGIAVISREPYSYSTAGNTKTSLTPTASCSSVSNLNGTDNGSMCNSNGSTSKVELGHINETEAHLELKFGICHSPIGTINNNKENVAHRDETSEDGHMSDDIKMINTNGSMSSRCSSPALDTDDISSTHKQKRTCVVRTLSIEATTATSPATKSASTLGLIYNSLA